MHNSHQTNAVGSTSKCVPDCTANEYYHINIYRNIVRFRSIFKAWEDRVILLMSSKLTQTQTPSFTIIPRMQCWLYSIRVQIIMSHFFHIKKKSIIISIVLVKFLTIVRWMYKIPSERGHKSTSTTHQRVREAIHCGNCGLASSGQKIGWICTHKASEINDCNFLWHLSFP